MGNQGSDFYVLNKNVFMSKWKGCKPKWQCKVNWKSGMSRSMFKKQFI